MQNIPCFDEAPAPKVSKSSTGASFLRPLLLAVGFFGIALTACKSDAPSPGAKPESPAPAASTAPAPAPAPPVPAGPALTIAYSDWPGWVAWDIGIQKGWFA